MINCAIVGTGRWGQRLVDSVQQEGKSRSDHLRFSHAVARTPAKAMEFARKEKLVLTDSLETVLADPSIDAIVLATPHDQHVAQILASLAAGKHVFAEKPLAMTYRDAQTVVQAAIEAGRILGVGHNRRFLPATVAMRSMLADGTLGEPVHVEGNFSNSSGLSYQASMWRAGEGDSKSAMTAMGVHVLDLFVHLLGEVEFVSAIGTRKAMPVEVNDSVSASMRFANGCSGYLSTLLSTPRQWRFQLFGTKGWVQMRSERVLDICDASGNVTTTEFDNVDSVKLELEAFAAAVEKKTPYVFSAFELVHVPAALEAVLKSSLEGGSRVAVQT